MIKKCAICKKEIDENNTSYAFMVQKETKSTAALKRREYGRFCSKCFDSLSLDEDDDAEVR